jgi:hypothetical protein
MANTTVADWLFLSPGDATLPNLGAGGGFTTQSAEVPADAQTDGFIAFTYLTDRGHDSSVDIQFSVRGWTIATRQIEFKSMHVAVTVTEEYFLFSTRERWHHPRRASEVLRWRGHCDLSEHDPVLPPLAEAPIETWRIGKTVGQWGGPRFQNGSCLPVMVFALAGRVLANEKVIGHPSGARVRRAGCRSGIRGR